MPERQRMTTRLKTLFQRPALFVLAGGINPIGAKMAEALGYDAFYMSGGNTSAHQLGWPDSGTSMRDMVDNARKIVLTVQIPVFADADTGYGDAISTHYTVREYIQAGIAGAHIEDQTFPPKSGPRRRCISIQEMVGKLRAAMDAKQAFDPDFVIMARCDLGGVPGASFAEVIDRCQAYKAEAPPVVARPVALPPRRSLALLGAQRLGHLRFENLLERGSHQCPQELFIPRQQGFHVNCSRLNFLAGHGVHPRQRIR